MIIRINNDFSKELSTNLGHILSADYIGSLAGALIYVFLLLRLFPITGGRLSHRRHELFFGPGHGSVFYEKQTDSRKDLDLCPHGPYRVRSGLGLCQ